MLAICSACGARTTKEYESYPAPCGRCGSRTMEKQVYPWKVQCDDCGHIKTHETTAENFRSCRCWCHDSASSRSLATKTQDTKANKKSAGR